VSSDVDPDGTARRSGLGALIGIKVLEEAGEQLDAGFGVIAVADGAPASSHFTFRTVGDGRDGKPENEALFEHLRIVRGKI
jgi:hypothetical protein